MAPAYLPEAGSLVIIPIPPLPSLLESNGKGLSNLEVRYYGG